METIHVAAALASQTLPEITADVSLPPNDAGIQRRSLASLQYSGIAMDTRPCTGPGCLIFYIAAIALMLALLLGIIAYSLLRRLRFRRAIAAGSVPAKMIVSNWNVPIAERGDVEAFAFPVSRPASREAVNEEGCPICFNSNPKPSSWVVFGVCGHATCVSCFRKLASKQRLLAACPMCRTLLATGKGERGGKKKKAEGSQQQQTGADESQAAAPEIPGSEVAASSPHSQDDNV